MEEVPGVVPAVQEHREALPGTQGTKAVSLHRCQVSRMVVAAPTVTPRSIHDPVVQPALEDQGEASTRLRLFSGLTKLIISSNISPSQVSLPWFLSLLLLPAVPGSDWTCSPTVTPAHWAVMLAVHQVQNRVA